MQAVEVRLFGPLEVAIDGRPVELGGRRQRALLAMLLLERGHPVSADRLVEAVWSGNAPPGALSSLYAYVARLRKTLGPAGSLLRNGSSGYFLQLPADSVDAWRFDTVIGDVIGSPGTRDAEQVIAALESALSLWRGPFLDGLSDFAWTSPVAAHLEGRRICAIELLADAQLSVGWPEPAVMLLEDAAREYWHREGLVSRLMLGLYRSGRQAEALAAYARCRAQLDDELGVVPSEQLRELHVAILEQRPELLRPVVGRRPGQRLLPLRNPRFFGRSDLIGEVVGLLEESRVVALEGMGGAGKSVVALEVAHAHRGYACWINAENEAATLASLTTIAGDRGLVSGSGADQTRLLRDLWRDLEGERTPLLVFDNAVDPAALTPYLPRIEHARILVTSRSAGWGALGDRVRVGPFTAEEAVSYLLDRTGTTDRSAAEELAEDLGRLPLACAQAAAFIEQSQIDLSQYRALFAGRREELLLRAAPDGYGQTVGTTWQLAFEELTAGAPAAALLLEVMAFLSPDGVAETLVRELFSPSDQDLGLADAVTELRRFSLINRDGATLTVHRLVQAVVRSRLDPATRLKRLTSAAELLIGTDPGDPDDPASWRAWSATAPHALVLGRLASESESPPPLMALLRSTASYLRQRGLFRSACDALSTAVDVAIHGHVDARTLGEMRSELGDLHDLAGDVHAARDEHARALELLEQEHSPEDERIVLARARLGHLLNCAGDSRAAITLLQDAVPTLRTSSGARHLIKACVDLGYACWAAGELAKAEASFQEALDELARAQVALPELYAEAMSGLGMVRQDQGDLVLAAQLIEGALAVLGEVFGEDDHPTLAQAHDKHGFVLRLHGKVAAAIDAHIEAHRMLSTTVGESDPRTAMALSNLGLAYRDAGRIAESVGAQQQAHELLLHSYGPEHRNTRFVAERLNELGISAIR